MSSLSEIKWDEVKSDSGYEVLPPGQYPVRVMSAEEKDTKSGGVLVAVQFQVTAGEHDGKRLFENFNIKNANVQAQNIGRAQIKELLKWKDALAVDGADELVGTDCVVAVKIHSDAEYGDRNRVRVLAPKKMKVESGLGI